MDSKEEVTWEIILNAHWKAFTDYLWMAFNKYVAEMDDSDGKVPFEKWREYILYDMQRRHDEEKQKRNN